MSAFSSLLVVPSLATNLGFCIDPAPPKRFLSGVLAWGNCTVHGSLRRKVLKILYCTWARVKDPEEGTMKSMSQLCIVFVKLWALEHKLNIILEIFMTTIAHHQPSYLRPQPCCFLLRARRIDKIVTWDWYQIFLTRSTWLLDLSAAPVPQQPQHQICFHIPFARRLSCRILFALRSYATSTFHLLTYLI